MNAESLLAEALAQAMSKDVTGWATAPYYADDQANLQENVVALLAHPQLARVLALGIAADEAGVSSISISRGLLTVTLVPSAR